jgi:hypothetical protein
LNTKIPNPHAFILRSLALQSTCLRLRIERLERHSENWRQRSNQQPRKRFNGSEALSSVLDPVSLGYDIFGAVGIAFSKFRKQITGRHSEGGSPQAKSGSLQTDIKDLQRSIKAVQKSVLSGRDGNELKYFWRCVSERLDFNFITFLKHANLESVNVNKDL